MRIQQRIQKSDLLWLLAFLLYEVIGTTRHEASHAIGCVSRKGQNHPVCGLALNHGRTFYWGCVDWSGSTDWLPVAAPYLCDLLIYLLFFFICTVLSTYL